VPRALRLPILIALLAAAAGTLAAQTAVLSPSPTLPSDTLEANYAPRSVQGPTPELAPSLPSDTLEATEPVDSFPSDSPGLDSTTSTSRAHPDVIFPDARPVTPADSAALLELKTWIEDHPGVPAPPPARAVLLRV
jgi:hypothetical protein